MHGHTSSILQIEKKQTWSYFKPQKILRGVQNIWIQWGKVFL